MEPKSTFLEQSPWFWIGMLAFGVILATGGLAAFAGGDGRIYEDIMGASAVVCVVCIFRWAILRERTKLTKKKSDESPCRGAK